MRANALKVGEPEPLPPKATDAAFTVRGRFVAIRWIVRRVIANRRRSIARPACIRLAKLVRPLTCSSGKRA